MRDGRAQLHTDEREPATAFSKLLARLAAPTVASVLLTAIVGLLVGGVAAASVERREAVYESSEPLLIDQSAALSFAPNGDLVSKLALLRTKYVAVLQSTSVLDATAAKLGVSVDRLGGVVSASAPPQSLIIDVRARSTSASRATELAAAASQSLAEYLDGEQERNAVPVETRITLTPLREASSAVQVEPDPNRSLTTGFTGGLLAAAGVYLVSSAASVWLPPRARRAR